jgi:hypothetical protein
MSSLRIEQIAAQRQHIARRLVEHWPTLSAITIARSVA